MSVRERGIIMQAESVRAILAGRKTQTRRAYRPRNPEPWELPPGEGYKDDGTPWPMYQDTYGDFHPVRCPYGAPGDRLWVRETWRQSFKRTTTDSGCTYLADYGHRLDLIGERAARNAWTWRPSIHMPRWASRLTLEVVEVRVQRVQEISTADVLSEGALMEPCGPYTAPGDEQIAWFRSGWDALNAKRGFPWASNPWVWVVTFNRVETSGVSV